jgi:phage baseplate assembly protein gpV
MDLIELSRLLANVICVGTIHSVDHAAVRVRVQIGQITTEWRPWLEHRAGETTTWDPPTIGEQVIVLSPSGEMSGSFVLRGLNSDAIAPPSHSADTHVTRWPDGTIVSYNHSTGVHEALYPDGAAIRYSHHDSHLEAIGITTALVRASTSITFDTPLTHITGKCVIDDLLTYNNGLCGYEGLVGNGSVINGTIRHHNGLHEQINVEQVGTGGKIVSNGIQVDTHHHGNVYPGSGTSGGPTP